MKTTIKMTLITVLLCAAQLSFGQYGQHLHDNDSLYDWGWSIQNKPDNTLFLFGWSENLKTGVVSLYNMNVSSDGGTVINKKILRADTMIIGTGNQGQLTQTPDGGYIAPLVKQWPNRTTSYLYCASGIIKYDALGDTVFTRTYTDTAVHFDFMYACTVMPNGDYIIGGNHALNTPSYYPAYIIRLKSNGDTVWTHTYQEDLSQSATINTLASLPNGHILVGAMTRRPENPSYVYYCDVPWFMELDSAGTVIKDTAYSKGFAYQGRIYTDRNGGYFHIGDFDSLKTSSPTDYVNFPGYIAHLDTNFRIEWLTEYVIDSHYNHRYLEGAKQLIDGNYLVFGEMRYHSRGFGWASKVSPVGKIMWNHYFVSDTDYTGYFRDVAEQSNGDLVFVGATYNDTLPTWHQQQDIWIVRTDSNGCVISGGCDPDTAIAPVDISAVTAVQRPAAAFHTYPNPTTGSFTVGSPSAGTFTIYTMLGQQLQAYTIPVGQTALQLPEGIAAGIYMGVFKPADGSRSSEVRLVYTP